MSDNNGNGPNNNDPSKIPPKLIRPAFPPPNMPPLPSGGKVNPYGKLSREVGEQVVKRLLVEGIVKVVKTAFKGTARVATEVVSQTAEESKAAVNRTAMADKLDASGEGIQALEYAAKSRNLDVGVLFQAVENIKERQQAALDGDKQVKSALEALDVSAEEIKNLRPDLLFKRVLEGVGPGQANTTRLNASAFLLGDQYEELRKYFKRDIPGLMDEFVEKGLAIDEVTTRNVVQFHDNLAEWKGYAQTAYQATKEFAANTYNKAMDPVRSWKARIGARFSKWRAQTISFTMQTANAATFYTAEPFAETSPTSRAATEQATSDIGEEGQEGILLATKHLKRVEADQATQKREERTRSEEEIRAAEEAQAAAHEAEVAARRLQAYSQLNLTDSSANSISSNLAPQLLDTQTAMLEELRELSRAVERNTQVIDQVLGSQ